MSDFVILYCILGLVFVGRRLVLEVLPEWDDDVGGHLVFGMVTPILLAFWPILLVAYYLNDSKRERLGRPCREPKAIRIDGKFRITDVERPNFSTGAYSFLASSMDGEDKIKVKACDTVLTEELAKEVEGEIVMLRINAKQLYDATTEANLNSIEWKGQNGSP
jgi:hypothetical protein